jgi:hypothetical protein
MKEKDAVIENLRADRDYWQQQAGVLLMNQRRAAKPGRPASTPRAPKG